MKKTTLPKLPMLRFGALYAAALGVALAAAMSCNPVIMVAPPGTSLALVANPRFISAHGGVSEITAILMKTTGVPVSDGTVVQFFTDLGRIEEQGRTNDGVARVKLVSDSRSGTANISAFSGGGSVTQPTSTATATATGTGTGSATTPPSTGGTTGTGGPTSSTTTVTIGNTNVTRILVNAVPARITTSRSTHVIATAFDSAGNPQAQVPIFFRITDPRNEFLDSSGNPVFTDNNGRAEDILRTRADFSTAPYNVTVSASSANGVEAQAVIGIN